MNSHKINNILEHFDYRLLENPEFKEDSVREEIVLPIIKGLGYSANKPNQIIRSRNLIHPFVAIGSQKKKIYIIPDYLFEVNDKPSWILDAKSPQKMSSNCESAFLKYKDAGCVVYDDVKFVMSIYSCFFPGKSLIMASLLGKEGYDRF